MGQVGSSFCIRFSFPFCFHKMYSTYISYSLLVNLSLKHVYF